VHNDSNTRVTYFTWQQRKKSRLLQFTTHEIGTELQNGVLVHRELLCEGNLEQQQRGRKESPQANWGYMKLKRKDFIVCGGVCRWGGVEGSDGMLYLGSVSGVEG
jgi:hypothetical protein